MGSPDHAAEARKWITWATADETNPKNVQPDPRDLLVVGTACVHGLLAIHEELRALREQAAPRRESELAYQVAGAAMSIAMQDHPDYVMPTERITEAVEAVLAEADTGGQE